MSHLIPMSGNVPRKIQDAIDAARRRENAFLAGHVPPTVAPVPAEISTFYGDMDIIPVVFAAAGDLLVLLRPKGLRVQLGIFNTLAANVINFAFNRQADNVSGIPIPAAGNAFFDNATPQGDLHVFSPIAGTILVSYINIAAPLATPAP
jgi:hypothetical protein